MQIEVQSTLLRLECDQQSQLGTNEEVLRTRCKKKSQGLQRSLRRFYINSELRDSAAMSNHIF